MVGGGFFLDVSLFIHTLEFRAKLTHIGLLVIVLLTLLLGELRFDPAVSQGTGCYGLTSQQPEGWLECCLQASAGIGLCFLSLFHHRSGAKKLVGHAVIQLALHAYALVSQRLLQ